MYSALQRLYEKYITKGKGEAREGSVRAVDLKSVTIDSAERIFLDGEELQNVKAYKLEHSADSERPAELTVTMYVNVGQVCSESSK